MKRRKKDFPLVILRLLAPFVKMKDEKFEVVDPKENLLRLIDRDPQSNYQFVVHKYRSDNGRFFLDISMSPASDQNTGTNSLTIPSTDLDKYLNLWISLLHDYVHIDSFYDDPILQSFHDEYFAEFEIVDDDANYKPFNPRQILWFDEYLEKIDNRLSELEGKFNIGNAQEIHSDIAQLRDNLGNKSKKWVVDKVAWIWAKITKHGPKLIKELMKEGAKEGVKQIAKAWIDAGMPNPFS